METVELSKVSFSKLRSWSGSCVPISVILIQQRTSPRKVMSERSLCRIATDLRDQDCTGYSPSCVGHVPMGRAHEGGEEGSRLRPSSTVRSVP